MNRVQIIFLESYSAAVCGREMTDPECSPKEWTDLFHMAHTQAVLPLLYDACFSMDSFKQIPAETRKTWKDMALRAAIRQITQTNEFLTLILHAQGQGLDPIVLKGIICRSLYFKQYLRPSVDEDILILPEEARSYHSFFVSEGLFEDDMNQASFEEHLDDGSELSYHKDNSPTYIEVHKTLFDPDLEVYGDFEKYFSGLADRTIRVQIEDVSVRTLAPTDHLLYLILHAFKHFIHSGIGIRAVCDIGLFAECYAIEIDWAHIRMSLEKVHAFDFARALFYIVQRNLLQAASFFDRIRDWHIDNTDVDPLLEDILAGGVHGDASLDRLHSSNITLNAVEKDKKASSASDGFLVTVFHSVFLPLGKMSAHYPYLKKAPILLPVAWTQRIFKYLQERKSSGFFNKNSVAESIRLGQSRVELLKKYGIIK